MIHEARTIAWQNVTSVRECVAKNKAQGLRPPTNTRAARIPFADARWKTGKAAHESSAISHKKKNALDWEDIMTYSSHQNRRAKNTAWGTKERTSTPQKGITNEKYDDLCYYITKHDVVNNVDLAAATLLPTR
ncbi:hypothetical protein Tco_1509330 [Tanacetum coccineum]